MVLYIEYIILDNFLIDLSILKLLACTFRERYRCRNYIFSSIVGVIGAILLPYMLFNEILSVIYRLLIAMLMICVLKRFFTIKSYIKHLLVLFGYTAMLGGCMVGLFNALNIQYTISGVLLYDLECPIGIFLLVILLTLYCIKKIIVVMGNSLRESSYMCSLLLEDRDKKLELRGFLDSGNMVSDNGEGVSIISLDAFERLYNNISLIQLLYGKVRDDRLKNIRYISIDGVDKGKEYLSFTIDKMCVDGREYVNQRIAVAHKNFGEFDCILNSDYLGVVK
ncbi:MAG: hypothetical protein E7354_00415 [Clostridiales bacterium]|nr:hypothetical protein [Clostridiales bacterium]